MSSLDHDDGPGSIVDGPNPDVPKLIRVRRGQWQDMLRRSPLPLTTKGVACILAQYGNADGTRNFPGVDRLARVCRVDEKTIRRHLTALREAGFVTRVQEADWRRRSALGIADEYLLTIPADWDERDAFLDPHEGTK